MTWMMSKLSWLTSTLLAPSTSATVAEALTFPSQVTRQALVDLSTAQVMADDGAEELVNMIRILLTTVASIHSGNYPLASSAAVTNARVVCASASEDTKTTDTMDDDDDDALDCLDEDNYLDVI